MLNHLKLIVWKNVLIRKRHWMLTIIEILIPTTLFLFMAYGRSKISGLTKEYINVPTYHTIHSLDDIYSHLDVGSLNLWYAPKSNETFNIIKKVQMKLQIPGDAVREFESKDDLLQCDELGKNSSILIGAVIFNSFKSINLNYDLTIYDRYLSWDTDKLFTSILTVEKARASKYLSKGFAALQVAIDTSFLELYVDEGNKSVTFSVQPFPDPPRFVDSKIHQLFMYFLPLITIFSFIFLCPGVLRRVGEEKVTGIIEYVKMSGLSSRIIWFGWFMYALSTNLISITIIIILMKVPFFDVPYPLIEHSDGTVLFVFLLLYCMSAITFCFLLANLFEKPSLATTSGILFWIVSYFVPQAFVNFFATYSWKFKIMFAFLPNMALYYGYSSMSEYEIREIGVHWSNLFKPGSGDDQDITMGNVFVMLITDAAIFMLLALYIGIVQPGKYGVGKPYHYPFTQIAKAIRRSFCLCINKSKYKEFYEPKERILEDNISIKIEDLSKRYSKASVLNNLNMNISRNAITVLLGKNGTGKTTTMSILTGMIDATSGNIIVNGMDMKQHIDEVKKIIGFCPQHNLLFPDLTVKEHLLFFAKLRNLKDINDSVKIVLQKLGIYDKKNETPNMLSGGTKRKLSLAIALLGSPEILILDEPTSGVDPESRRKIWNLLLEYRHSKTVLITTHLMDEAEVLADHVAIMSFGQLQHFGTPLELKTKLKTGCHLDVSLGSERYKKDIKKAVQEHFPQAGFMQDTHNIMSFLLPLNENARYKSLAAHMENNQRNWDIKTININISTLDDVFLKVQEESGANNCTDSLIVDLKKFKDGAMEELLKLEKHRKQQLTTNVVALVRKRWYFLKKQYYRLIPSVVIAICIFLLAVWLALSTDGFYENTGPSLNLSLEVYGKTKIFCGYKNSSSDLTKTIKEYYEKTAKEEQQDVEFQPNISKSIIKAGASNIAYYKKHMVAAAEFNTTNDTVIVNSMYSSEALHGIPISINLGMNAIIKALLNESFSITIRNTPLKPSHLQLIPAELYLMNVASTWSILFPLSMFFFTCNFIVFPHTEISTGFMQLQTTAGVQRSFTFIYWITNGIFDLLFSIIPLTLLFGLVLLLNYLCFNWVAFEFEDIWAIIVIFTVYVVTSLPFTYLFAYRISITGAIAQFLILGVFTGIVPTLILTAMKFSQTESFLTVASSYLQIFLTFFSPQFGLSHITIKFSRQFVNNFNWKYMNPNKRLHLCNTEPTPCCYNPETEACTKYQSYFQNTNFGVQTDLLILLGTCTLYYIILIYLNSYFVKQILSNVSNFNTKYFSRNAEKIAEKKLFSKILSVKGLVKKYGKNFAVKTIKFDLMKGECFGLLGVNGAGKSTTFRMLTKCLVPDRGEVCVNVPETRTRKSISITTAEYCENIGYCPQEDCLNFYLTGKETLTTMALLKGYSQKNANTVADKLLEHFNLKDYADKECSTYSGGTRRRLATCIAFLGASKAIFLDEPTTGVDPEGRRKFWDILSYFKRFKQTSFLLCSHSMEECENLCEEVAIMKAGEIKAKGPTWVLKESHKCGFKITIKVNRANIEEENGVNVNVQLKDGTTNYVEITGKISKKLNTNIVKTEDNLIKIKIFQKSRNDIENVLNKLKKQYKDDILNFNFDPTFSEKVSKLNQSLVTKLNAELKDECVDSLTYHVYDNHKQLSEIFADLEAVKSENEGVENYVITQTSLEDVFLSVANSE